MQDSGVKAPAKLETGLVFTRISCIKFMPLARNAISPVHFTVQYLPHRHGQFTATISGHLTYTSYPAPSLIFKCLTTCLSSGVMSHSKSTLFVQRCLSQRIDGDEFQDMAVCMIEKHYATGQALLNTVIRCRGSFCPTEDPLIPLYVRVLVALGLAHISDVLFTLVQIWNQSESRKVEVEQPGIISRSDTSIVLDLATTIASNERREEPDTTRKSLVLSSRWLSAMMKWLSELSSQTPIHPVVTLIEAIGSLIAALASSDNGMALLANKDKTGELKPLLLGPRR